ncbi:phosphatidylinositol-glycan biosynthesis class X protein [Anabrus simplex]|uniref:phosphatidylinositol-glycan biosynthesis class X protein n=1 Tax=Anabrus simplex TaxID=316456 RepID=UPI0034DCCD39
MKIFKIIIFSTYYCTFLLCTTIECLEKCDIHATITRHVENEGFHRELHSLIEVIMGQPKLLTKCYVVLEELLPSGLYVNPDQLADLRRLGQVSACAQGHVDVEAPKQNSSSHLVHVYSFLEQTQNLLSAKVILPFHLRYHNPKPSGGYAQVHLDAPTLLLHCPVKVPCLEKHKKVIAPCRPCGKAKCQWHSVPYKTNSPNIKLSVPVGNLDHYFLVTVCTLFVTCVAAVYILSVAIVSKQQQGKYD